MMQTDLFIYRLILFLLFQSLLILDVPVGSEVKWGPWSTSINLLSDLKKITLFLMPILGMCYNRTNSVTSNAVGFLRLFKVFWKGLQILDLKAHQIVSLFQVIWRKQGIFSNQFLFSVGILSSLLGVILVFGLLCFHSSIIDVKL